MKGTRLFLTAILKNFKLKQHFTDKDTFIFCFDLSTDQSVYRTQTQLITAIAEC